MNPYQELTDEELFALIETAEEQGLISAPRELKSVILAEADQKLQIKPAPSRQKQFTAYCFRVGLATAASLVILFSSGPMPSSTSRQPEQEITISQRFNQFTEQVEQGFLNISQKLSQFDFNFGGNHHE